MHPLLPLLATLALALTACSKSEAPATAPAAAAAPAPAAHPPAAQAAAAVAQYGGKVLQVQQGGGYTFAEVASKSGQNAWVAGMQIDLKPGDTVTWNSHAVMKNFTAKSIGRTFDEILFVDQWGPAGGQAVGLQPHGNMPMPAGAAPAGGGAGGDSGVVKSVANAGGYSYIEVERGGSTLWVAAMETPLKPGDKVQWQGGSQMNNFTAKALGRTFERITFASSVAVVR